MIDEKIKDYYKSWLYEKKRAQKFGKTNYEKNCDIEIARLEEKYPELKVSKKEMNDSIEINTIEEYKK